MKYFFVDFDAQTCRDFVSRIKALPETLYHVVIFHTTGKTTTDQYSHIEEPWLTRYPTTTTTNKEANAISMCLAISDFLYTSEQFDSTKDRLYIVVGRDNRYAEEMLSRLGQHFRNPKIELVELQESFSQELLMRADDTYPIQRQITDFEEDPHRKCADCGMIFQYEWEWQKHVAQIHNWRCDHCGEVFVSESSLQQHIGNAASRSECQVCARRFTVKRFCDAETLRQHMEKSHVKCHCCEDVWCFDAVDLTYHEKIVLPHECPSCKLRFRTEKLLSHHQLTEHAGQCHTCDKCGTIFSSLSGMNRHYINAHLQ